MPGSYGGPPKDPFHCLVCGEKFFRRASRQRCCSEVCRFWNSVNTRGHDECWEWNIRTTAGGYGVFRLDDRSFVKAHRMCHLICKGKIPEGMWVLHSCDNKLCVNPSHLRIGTPQDNTNDMIKRGRAPKPKIGNHHYSKIYPEKVARGSVSGHAKLTEDGVILLRKARKNHTLKELAKIFGVSVGTADKACRGLTWRHVKTSA